MNLTTTSHRLMTQSVPDAANWWCLPGGIAWYARRFIDLARQAAEPPPSTIAAGVWDEFFGPDDGTVPPVPGADDEDGGWRR